ncbi:MAG: acetyl-CoA carboxylase biotin carboxyl carrier protein [bacterium]|nr:acetyl-CoA carboxylase biotin carboxyl carrier protein [bacterium]
MNLKEIQELIEMIRGTDISEIEFEREGARVKISMGSTPVVPVVGPGLASGMLADRVDVEPALIKETGAGEPEIPEMVPGQIVVTSPMVGTFYRSPAPESPPFVEVGTVVEVGQSLCIIEAMKLMNEIEAERQGKILKILKEDKDPVEYGEPLFILGPLT